MEENVHKMITATYAMYEIVNGAEQLLEATPENQPIKLMTGFNMTPLSALEDKLASTPDGENYELTLSPKEAFGPYNENDVTDIDKKYFCKDDQFDADRFPIGAILPMQNQKGQRFLAKIVSIGEESVKMDFNHPYAGKTVKLTGTVIESHTATEEEIEAIASPKHCKCGGHCHSEGGCNGDCHEGGCGEGECHCGDGECNCER